MRQQESRTSSTARATWRLPISEQDSPLGDFRFQASPLVRGIGTALIMFEASPIP